jgi:hypothetical protein
MRKKVSPSRVAATPSSPAPHAPSGSLVVVELGGEWPQLPESDRSVRRVLAQLEGETPTLFAERVAGSLEDLFGKGIQLGAVALACNERIDAAADAARRKIGGISLGAMAAHKRGKVVLTASPLSSGRLRHSLSSLAHGLFDEWRTAGLEVTVEFGEEARSAPTAAPFAFTSRVA